MILHDSIVFYKPLMAEVSPRRGFFFGKNTSPEIWNMSFWDFVIFGSILGSQEGPFKDFLIFIFGFKSDRSLLPRFLLVVRLG